MAQGGVAQGGVAQGGVDRATSRPAHEEASRALRSCLAQFATGVTVVTFDTPVGPRGLTVNAFTSVSLRPPLVLVSVAKTAHAHDLLQDRAFCVNVLGAGQEELARQFAGQLGQDVPHRVVASEHGIPRLEGTIAFLECAPWRMYDAGDHSLFLGEVLHFGHCEGEALVYLSHRFTSIVEPELGIEYLI